MTRYVLKRRTVVDVIDTRTSDALHTYREEDIDQASEHAKQLEELNAANESEQAAAEETVVPQP